MSEEAESRVDTLFCWKDATVVCGPSCVAYESNKDALRDSSCKLLNLGSVVASRLQRLVEKVGK